MATPHIAGYSLEGKKRGTAMAVDALCRHFGWDIKPEWPAAPQNGASNVTIGKIMDSYNPLAETALLKNHGGDIASTFESLRNHYAYRAEVFD